MKTRIENIRYRIYKDEKDHNSMLFCQKNSRNISYSMEESGPFLWWKVGATQRLNIKLQSKSEPLKVEH